MQTLFRTFCLLIAFGLSSIAQAEVVAIVSASNTSDITGKDIERIFLGKQKQFSGGQEAIPLDQNKGEGARAEFLATFLKKSESQLKAYWSRLIFTGKGSPPKTAGGNADILQLVETNPNVIGYIDKQFVSDKVRVIVVQ